MAFQSFLQRFKQGKEKLGYPKFRSKRRHRQSSDVPQNFTMNFATSRVQLPKIGTIKTAIHRRIIGKLKTCTVVSTNTGRVFINIVVEDGLSAPMKPPVMKKNSLGIDLGLTTYATTSSGVKIENPRHLQNAMKRLQCLHRRMSKKKLGSKNREKARLRLAFCKKSTSLNKGGTFSINFPRI
jgi:putative transposase